MSDQIIFQSRLIYQDQKFEAILTSKELILQNNQGKYIFQVDDWIALSHCEAKDDHNLFGFTVNSYPLIKGKRVFREYFFACLNQSIQNQWLETLNKIINSSIKHLQIVVNSASGTKNTDSILEKICSLFTKANIDFRIEKPINVAATRQFIQEIDLSSFDGLVIVGGDGTIHDVINSLMSRKDDNKGIKIPIGIIPSGTGNGLSKSILEVSGEAYDPVNAAFLIVKGKTKSIDLMLTQQNNQIYYSILSLSWGLISDVDVESEKLRFLGSLRNDLYAIIRIMFLKSYRGKFYFLPAFNKVFSEDLAIKQEDGWYLIEADFVLFWAMNVPWASHSFQPTPQAKLDDGMIDILIVRKGVSRSKLLKALLLIGEENI
jgi:sphingosine kinase